jgi:hypothetical protein
VIVNGEPGIRRRKTMARQAFNVPTADQYRAAFASITLTDNEKQMLRNHFHAHARSATFTEIGGAIANATYGKLGRKISEAIEPNYKFKTYVWGGETRMFLAGVIGELSAYGNAADGRDLLVMNHEIAKVLAEQDWI